MGQRQRAPLVPGRPKRPRDLDDPPVIRREPLAGGIEAALAKVQPAGNRALARAVVPAQLHPAHPIPWPESVVDRYTVAGVDVPRKRRGWSLPIQMRSRLERSFRTDLSTVRVVEDESATELDATAYTRGADIIMAPGHYQPHSGSGRRLIAHEIVHSIQQRAGRVKADDDGMGLPVNRDRELEWEAERLGRRAAWDMPAEVKGARDPVRHPPAGAVQPHM